MRNKGFTLIELLVVVSIILILLGLTGVGVLGALRKSKIHTARTEVAQILNAVKMYKSDIGDYPGKIDEDYLGVSLSKLTVWGGGLSSEKVFGPYYEFKKGNSTGSSPNRTLQDPWGNSYVYYAPDPLSALGGVPNEVNSTRKNGFPVVYSDGPDGNASQDDDIIGTWQ